MQRFMAAYDDIPNKTKSIPAGISMNMDDDGKLEYVCAAEVSKFPKPPRG